MNDTMNESTWQTGEGYETEQEPTDTATEAAKRVMLAGLGAVAMACDTAEDTFDRFVDRGQQVQSDLEERAREARSGRLMRRTRLGNAVRNAMDAFLDSVSIPNKADVDTINVKLNILTRKIDDLQMEQVTGNVSPGATANPPGMPTPASPPPVPDQEQAT